MMKICLILMSFPRNLDIDTLMLPFPIQNPDFWEGSEEGLEEEEDIVWTEYIHMGHPVPTILHLLFPLNKSF